MPIPLSVLIVEDMESDAQLLVRLLKKAGYEPVYKQVESAEQMRDALKQRTWDIVISDYKMPQFDGHTALELLKETGLDIPFIIVSGTLGEEVAVSMMKAGAQDYLTKGNLARLTPAVKRELEQAELRRELKRDQEQLLLKSSALNAAANAIVITDRKGIIEWVNPAFNLLTGYVLEEVVGKNLRDLVKSGKHDQSFYKNLWDTILAGGVWHGELVNRRKDGSLYPEEETITPLINSDGTIGHFIAIKQDISARKQAEKSLHEQEEQYRTLVEQLPAIVFIDDVNGEGRTLYISPQIETILGFTQQEWQEKSPDIWINQVHPDDLERVHEAYMRCLQLGEPYDAEYRIRALDGRLLWFRDQAIMLHNESGKPHLIHGVMYDITERKQAEASLRTSDKRYRELFNSMIDGFALHEIICDESGKPSDYRFLEVNPAFERLTGLQSANLIGRTVLEVMPNTESYWIEIYGNVALTGRSTFFENYASELNRHFEVSAYCPMQGQFAIVMVDITERKQAEEGIRQRVTELETLYQSGLALSQLLNPKEIGQKILELLEEKLGWHHTRIRLYHPQDDSLELLDFNQPGLKGEAQRREVVEHFQTLITHSGQGMNGWVIQHGQSVRSGEVSNDPRYVEAYSGIHSGLYVPMKLGERIVGVISIEDEQPNAFRETDERLIATLANQAASAFENARLFNEIRKHAEELETLNRISLVLRTASKQEEMLTIVLDEALGILNTSHGCIELYYKATGNLEKIITRGWITRVNEPPQHINEGIAGKVFMSGETYISREFASDPETRAEARSQIPFNWGGACLPIRTTQQTLGVMIVSVPSNRELDKDEIRLLSILSEMTGAALQRMQLHEQTVHRLEQLNALRAVDQAISSSLDMRLTLNILLTHTISQLNVDAADVLLLHPDSNLLELMGGRGFHTLRLESVSLSDSYAKRAIMEHRPIMSLDFETAALNEDRQLGKFWKAEGFVCYWCVPLIVKGEAKGVLEVYQRKAFTPDVDWLGFLEALAGQAAIAIENTQLFENLQHANLDLGLAYDATIEGWSRAMELRDEETEGHTRRVTDLTVNFAKVMGIKDIELLHIRRGALLHDIGKMGVPDQILLKKEKLSESEWEIMRKHPQFAYDMLKPIYYLRQSLDIPYCHHEKWDGTGYPRGLKGEQIPLAARIFAIADVYDAVTSDRPYRKAWTREKALEHIREQSGSHFDPQIVEKFLKLKKR